MSKSKAIIYAILAAAAVVLFFAMNSETAKIKRVFASLERMARREAAETILESAAKAQTLSRFFTSPCRFSCQEPRFDTQIGRDDLSGAILAFRSGAGVFEIEFSGLDVAVEGSLAQVDGTATVKGGTVASRIGRSSQRFLAELEKRDGKWLIAGVRAYNP